MNQLEKSIKNTIKKAFELSRGEEVLIVTDEQKLNIARIFAKTMKQSNAQVNTYLLLEETRPVTDTTPCFEASIKTTDLLIYLLDNRTEEKPFRGRMVDLGRRHARVCMMPDITEEMVKRTFHVDYDKLRDFTHKLVRTLKNTEEIQVTDQKNTEITFSVKGRKFQQETGKITRRGSYGNLPSGEIFTAPIEKTFTGEIYFDHISDFRTGSGYLKFEQGEVTEHKGLPEELEEIMKEKRNRTIGEFGIGTNPKAKPDKGFLESEKALHTLHFGVGDSYGLGKNKANYRFAFLIEKPTMKADGETIMEKGQFQID